MHLHTQRLGRPGPSDRATDAALAASRRGPRGAAAAIPGEWKQMKSCEGFFLCVCVCVFRVFLQDSLWKNLAHLRPPAPWQLLLRGGPGNFRVCATRRPQRPREAALPRRREQVGLLGRKKTSEKEDFLQFFDSCVYQISEALWSVCLKPRFTSFCKHLFCLSRPDHQFCSMWSRALAPFPFPNSLARSVAPRIM